MMIEPTESESKEEELDRFCDALIAIHSEMQRIASGEWPRDKNPLKLAPHTAPVVTADAWDRPYSRELAAYPAPWLREHKFWPPCGPDRQCLRRPQSGVFLFADGRVRGVTNSYFFANATEPRR